MHLEMCLSTCILHAVGSLLIHVYCLLYYWFVNMPDRLPIHLVVPIHLLRENASEDCRMYLQAQHVLQIHVAGLHGEDDHPYVAADAGSHSKKEDHQLQ